uniref:Uncharacterized protein n=1 Tax=Globodera rostochiensis TaxID=31243 RepID=A0A914I453_GLORO
MYDLNLEKSIFGELTILRRSREGDIDKLETLVLGGVDVNETIDSGQSPLIVASFFGQTGAVRFLLAEGARISATDVRGCTALICASSRGHIAVCRVLVEKGADINTESLAGGTAWLLCCGEGHLEIVTYFVEERAQDVERRNSRGQTAVMFAAYFSQPHIVQYLLSKGARRDQRNGMEHFLGGTARGHGEIVVLLTDEAAH